MKLHLAGFKYASASFKYPPIKIHQYLHRHSFPSFPKAHQDFTTFKYFPTRVYDILFLALHSKFIVVATFQIFLTCFSTEISATLSIFKIFSNIILMFFSYVSLVIEIYFVVYASFLIFYIFYKTFTINLLTC
jgi:hypothetical protein